MSNTPKRLLFLLVVALVPTAAGGEPAIAVTGLFKDKAIVSIDGHQHLLSVGQSSPGGIRLIAASSEEAVLEVEGARRTFRLGSTQGARFKPRSAKAVAIMADARGMYAIDGNINGGPVRFLVDTGATMVSMNQHEASRLGLSYEQGQPARVSTASGMAKAYVVKLDRVKVGAIELHNVDAAVLEGDSPDHTLLGMSFLGRVEMYNVEGVLQLRQKY